MMEDLDPEKARAIIDPALKLMIDAAHRYDGYVVQSTGDGIFAPFGEPRNADGDGHADDSRDSNVNGNVDRECDCSVVFHARTGRGDIAAAKPLPSQDPDLHRFLRHQHETLRFGVTPRRGGSVSIGDWSEPKNGSFLPKIHQTQKFARSRRIRL
jgi:class 3 adenylate cyclase